MISFERTTCVCIQISIHTFTVICQYSWQILSMRSLDIVQQMAINVNIKMNMGLSVNNASENSLKLQEKSTKLSLTGNCCRVENNAHMCQLQ